MLKRVMLAYRTPLRFLVTKKLIIIPIKQKDVTKKLEWMNDSLTP